MGFIIGIRAADVKEKRIDTEKLLHVARGAKVVADQRWPYQVLRSSFLQHVCRRAVKNCEIGRLADSVGGRKREGFGPK